MIMKLRKFIAFLVAVSFIFSMPGFSSVALAFRDVTSETGEAIEKFNSEGLFGSFIYKYGQDLFRPDGTVSRGDLILLLNEYHIIISKLLANDRTVMAKLRSVGSSRSKAADVDTVLRELQKVLDPMLKKTETIKSLQASYTPSGGSSIDNSEITRLESQIERLTAKLDDMEYKYKTASAGGASASGKQSAGGPVSKEDIIAVKKDIKEIEKKIWRQEKKLDMMSLDSGSTAASASSGFPFWARVSLGFSFLALFVMAR